MRVVLGGRWRHSHGGHHGESSVGVGPWRHAVRGELIRVHIGRRWIHVGRIVGRRKVEIWMEGWVAILSFSRQSLTMVPLFLAHVSLFVPIS